MPKLTKADPSLRKHRSGQFFIELNRRVVYLGTAKRAANKRRQEIIDRWNAAGRSREFDPRNATAMLAPTTPAVPASSPSPPSTITVSEVLAAYYAWAVKRYGVGPTSEIHRIRCVVKATRQLFGATLAVEFSPRKFIRVRDELITRNLARTNINATMQRLRSAFRWATENELLADGRVQAALSAVKPLLFGQSEARESEPIEAVPDELIDATLPHLSPVVADMVRLQRLFGCRPSEICRLRLCDIDRSQDVWIFRLRKHKTAWAGHKREIPIGPNAQQILRRYIEGGGVDPNGPCFTKDRADKCRSAAPKRRRRRDDTNNAFDSRSYARSIRVGCEAAFPVPDEIAADPAAVKAWGKAHYWSPLRIRHTAAVATRKEHGLEAAQSLLGHASLQTTEKFYAGANIELATLVARERG